MTRTRRQPAPSLVVQQSFPDPRPTTNPYIVMLRDAIDGTAGVTLRTFSWRSVLLEPYDVFHVHWPEILVSGATTGRTIVRQLLAGALLLRLRVTRTPVVRTLHNVERPAGLSPVQHLLLNGFDRRTALTVLLNTSTSAPAGQPSSLILHGHYRDWFARHARATKVRGRFAYFGLIREHKGLDRLVEAFKELPGPVSLKMAGKPASATLQQQLTDLAKDDERVSLTFAYLDDADLVAVATSGELVVLPYREMHNSGSVLAALSLDLPVLVPDNEVNRRLAEEVGPGWVHTYSGELTPQVLDAALQDVRSTPRSERPDLSTREWDLAGQRHVEAYRAAIAQRTR